MRRSLSWGSTRLALAVWCVLAGGLLFASTPAFASGGPETPITEVCSGPIKAGGGWKVCGTLNPHSSEKLTSAYFTFSPGSVCTGKTKVPIDIIAGQEEAIKVSAELTGLEPNTKYAYCLVAKNSVGETSSLPATFQTAPAAPAIQNVSSSEITDVNATLEAQISSENSETKYEVVLADPCAGPPECIVDVPLASGTIPATTAREYVRVELANKELNLEPNMTYEYWVIAKNTVGPTEVRETFATLKTPSIDSEAASDISEHDAILEAMINPEGQDVRYQFQIARNASEFLPGLACPTGHTAGLCLGSPVTAGALPIGFLVAGSSDDSVGVDLEREIGVTLQPETTYHYRVIAVSSPLTEDTVEWKGPTVYGADQTFTTQGVKTTGLDGLLTSGSFSGGSGNFAPQGGRALSPVKPKTPAQVKAAKLARTLRLCKKDHKKSKRAKCEKAAKKKYGPLKTKRKRK
jgi:hypothetical protein